MHTHLLFAQCVATQSRYIHRFLFAACTSFGQSMSRRVLAWSRDFMEAIVEPERASTPGDARFPRAQALYISFLPVVYLSSNKPPPLVRRTYLVREKYYVAGASLHGLER